ncbi:PREDICTED: uncharacterized protein LOC105454563 [Wasmannia auropunctata]|uniref:uncharacterized protein LOC105454563 n=1 Tax=Wasmannia auropunctata TaxID=64793 RepID=UPI0005EE4234|nr:PREDICTED: uncharacterized protein LOC105454563 [Wasmannia auropunctata]
MHLVYHIFNMISIVLLPIAVCIFKDGIRINESQLRQVIQMILPKHFVGKESYLYLIFLHSGAAACIGGIVLVSTLMMCVTYTKHACGIFRIASYRLENAITVNTLQNFNLKSEILISKEIIRAVDIHRKAIKFTALFFSGFEQSRFVLIIFTVLTLSLNLYGISVTISLEEFTEEFFLHCMVVGALFIYLFLINYAGQEFIDHNDHIFSTAYNIQWYIAPLHVQKLILFLLQKGMKTDSLQFGVLFSLSLELFASVKIVIYFITPHSIQCACVCIECLNGERAKPHNYELCPHCK